MFAAEQAARLATLRLAGALPAEAATLPDRLVAPEAAMDVAAQAAAEAAIPEVAQAEALTQEALPAEALIREVRLAEAAHVAATLEALPAEVLLTQEVRLAGAAAQEAL